MRSVYVRTDINNWKRRLSGLATPTGQIMWVRMRTEEPKLIGLKESSLANYEVELIGTGEVLSIRSFMVFTIVNATLDSHNVGDFGFGLEYKGAESILEPFHNYVLAVSGLNPSFFAKLFHLPQSSGTGKTRLCTEYLLKLARRGAYCVYRQPAVETRTREMLTSGYPPANEWTKWLIKEFKRIETDEQAEALCIRFLSVMVQQFDCYDTDSLICQAEELFAGKALRKAAAIVKALDDANDDTSFHTQAIKDGCHEKPFLIVFDECDELLFAPDPPILSEQQLNSRGGPVKTRITLYRALRRALYRLKESNLVAVFLGTKSSLDDFVLTWRYDPSLRQVPSDRIVPPYIFTQSIDVQLTEPWHISYSGIMQRNGTLDTAILQNFSKKCGRPLWSCYETFWKAVQIAVHKLKDLASGDDDKLLYLTPLIIRSGLQVAPPDELTHKLVLKGMALLKYVDFPGTRCLIEYVPEPVLSTAAKFIMSSDADFLTGLMELVRLQHLGTFYNSGKAGELAARLFLTRAMDKCVPVSGWNQISEIPLAVTTLRNYLAALTGLSAQELSNFDVSDEMMDGLVSANQVIQLHNAKVKIDQSFLMNGFARSCSFALFTNAPGADDIIPVLRTDNRMGCIAIQTKNRRANFPVKFDEFSKGIQIENLKFLDLEKTGDFEALPDADDFIRIVIQFGAPDRPGANHRWWQVNDPFSSYGRRKVLWLNGISALDHLVCLQSSTSLAVKNEIISYLQDLIAGDWNFVQGIDFSSMSAITNLQSTLQGAQALQMYSNPFDNLGFTDLQYRRRFADDNAAFLPILNTAGIRDEAFSHRKRFTITTKGETIAAIASAKSGIVTGQGADVDYELPEDVEFVEKKSLKASEQASFNLNIDAATELQTASPALELTTDVSHISLPTESPDFSESIQIIQFSNPSPPTNTELSQESASSVPSEPFSFTVQSQSFEEFHHTEHEIANPLQGSQDSEKEAATSVDETESEAIRPTSADEKEAESIESGSKEKRPLAESQSGLRRSLRFRGRSKQ